MKEGEKTNHRAGICGIVSEEKLWQLLASLASMSVEPEMQEMARRKWTGTMCTSVMESKRPRVWSSNVVAGINKSKYTSKRCFTDKAQKHNPSFRELVKISVDYLKMPFPQSRFWQPGIHSENRGGRPSASIRNKALQADTHRCRGEGLCLPITFSDCASSSSSW